LIIENESERLLVDKIVENNNLDIWSDNLNDVMVTPAQKDLFKNAGIKYTVFIEDVGAIIASNEAQHESLKGGAFFDTFRSTAEVMEFVDELKATYPDMITTSEIGKTLDGKSIVGVHIASGKGSPDKPRIFFFGGQHAREWITVTTVNYIVDHFLKGYGSNDTLTTLLDFFDWTYIPILNVDGYDYTWTNDRLWRKNRRVNSGTTCRGVDTNRNWSYMWNRGGSSTNPCTETYHGVGPNSEAESSSVSRFLTSTPRIKLFIDFHSYSQLLMSPYGYTNAYPPDYGGQLVMMQDTVNAIRRVHNVVYTPGSIANTIYIASGSSVDYAYSLGIVHSYTYELRDTGRFGFVLPANQIVPQGEEIIDGMIMMLNNLMAEETRKK